MGLQWLQGTNVAARNTWECAFCRRRQNRSIVLTIDNGRAGQQRVRCCDLECLRHFLTLWEELETKQGNDA